MIFDESNIKITKTLLKISINLLFCIEISHQQKDRNIEIPINIV